MFRNAASGDAAPVDGDGLGGAENESDASAPANGVCGTYCSVRLGVDTGDGAYDAENARCAAGAAAFESGATRRRAEPGVDADKGVAGGGCLSGVRACAGGAGGGGAAKRSASAHCAMFAASRPNTSVSAEPQHAPHINTRRRARRTENAQTGAGTSRRSATVRSARAGEGTGRSAVSVPSATSASALFVSRTDASVRDGVSQASVETGIASREAGRVCGVWMGRLQNALAIHLASRPHTYFIHRVTAWRASLASGL
jgi:hypothetical protein